MKALLRLSPEITTKAPKTRARFVRCLVHNLKAAFAAQGLSVDITRDHSRIYLEYDRPETLMVARRIFGVHSVSPCREEPLTDLAELVRRGTELMSSRVQGKTFAVRTRVRDGRAEFSGQQVNEELGRALTAFGRVYLDDPEVTVHLEVREGRVHFFTDVFPAEGGMPIGVGGRAVVLLSAGFDSAVAGWLMLRRGVQVDFVSCRLGGPPHERAVLAVANRLISGWATGLGSRLLVVPFEEEVERLLATVAERYRQLVLKRLMYRVAYTVAKITRADAVVTGESIGQVSSQTLPNLRALTTEAQVPILRPLLGYTKLEIMSLASRIGTHHLSSGVPEYCALGTRPATSAKRHEIAAEEALVDFDEERAVDAGRFIELPSERLIDGEDVGTDRVQEGAVVLDLRSPPARSGRAIEGARVIDPLEVISAPKLLDAEADYVVVCDSGARSDWFVRRLRDLGFRAWSLREETADG